MPKFDLYAAFNKASNYPLGKQAVSIVYRAAAPYFLTAPLQLEELEPGRGVATMSDRPWNRNHLGTIHAISLCNLAEYVMGAVAEATVPAQTHRWIPQGMTVAYTAKAVGKMTANATLTLPEPLGEKTQLPVEISVTDTSGKEVFTATITIYVTQKPVK